MKGLNDVPFMLCTMRDEDDVSQNNTIVNWTKDQFTSFLTENFAPWSSNLGDIVASLVGLYGPRTHRQTPLVLRCCELSQYVCCLLSAVCCLLSVVCMSMCVSVCSTLMLPRRTPGKLFTTWMRTRE
jgi:hypothetical protein